ncbi:hypothetical protein bcere0016_46530 [Bacillus cereus 95/8201]|nr:hypothetical protein bcere0016_46530 [Bacillus cereus 95/8201]EEM75393.1 hypothetical protein bthur0010_45380 [Bacillus thuringiensis serovar pondicheriensis BGSC 4BA1]
MLRIFEKLALLVENVAEHIERAYMYIVSIEYLLQSEISSLY